MDECDSLKQFIIPKRRTSASETLIAVDPNSIEYKNDIFEIIQLHSKHKDSLNCFSFNNAHFVQNPILLAEFNEKRKLMKEICNDKELKCTYAFLHCHSRFEAESICKEGLRVGNSEFKSLGDPLLGAYVCKYSDVLPPLMTGRDSTSYLIILKFIKGKVKTMVENKTGDALEPTPGWDCHVTKSSHQSDACEFESSQVYVYEYDNNLEVLERPRQLLPFALVSFKVNVNKLYHPRFQAGSVKKSIGYKPGWAQPFFKENDALTPEAPKKNASHPLTFHQRQPYLLWSGAMIISNRIICSINMYSDFFIICPFYVGPDIKLNSEFKTDKLFSHFFLDKLQQLNKKEFTSWNNVYYTYVKLKCTESTAVKFLKVANYLQDNDSSLLCSLNDAAVLIVCSNCKQAEKLGLDDPSYMHGIFVSSSPRVFDTKHSGQTLKQLVDGINKAMPPPVINKSDPRQMKRLMALEESISVMDILSKSKLQESCPEFATESVENQFAGVDFNVNESEVLDKSNSMVSAVDDSQMDDTIAASPIKDDTIEFDEDFSNILPLPKISDNTSDASGINDREQDIIKLKLSLKTLYMPFMKNSMKSTQAQVMTNLEVDNDSVEEVNDQVESDDKGVQISDKLDAADDDDGKNLNDKANENEAFTEKDAEDLPEDVAKDSVMERKEKLEEEEEDMMDDELADQIVMRCLQPSFMSPHIKLDSLSHTNVARTDQDVREENDADKIEGDSLHETSTSNDAFSVVKKEFVVKTEPVMQQRCDVVRHRKKHEDSLESGEILSSTERPDSGDELGREGAEIIISDDDTESGSSVIVLEHLCTIPVQRRKLLHKNAPESDSPIMVFEYGDDGQTIYRNIQVKVLDNNTRALEVKRDEIWSSYGKDASVLDERVLFEVFGKNATLQQKEFRPETTSQKTQRFVETPSLGPISVLTSNITERKFEIGLPSTDLKARLICDAPYVPNARGKDATPDSWESFLGMFLSESSSGILDPGKNLTTVFQCESNLSSTIRRYSEPRFNRPLYVYKATFEEIQETFGALSKEDQDSDEPVYDNEEIRFYEERKKCASLLDEWISEKSSGANVDSEAGICNLRWFQCLNKDGGSKVEMKLLRKSHDDFVDSRFFITSMEDELSRSGIPFLEDVKEESPESFQEYEDFSFSCLKEYSSNTWPSRLQIVDVPKKRHPLPRATFKMLPRVLSLEIHTYEDPRLSPSISHDSIYWSLLSGCSDCDYNDNKDIKSDTLIPDFHSLNGYPENLIVTGHICPESNIASLKGNSSELKLKSDPNNDYEENRDIILMDPCQDVALESLSNDVPNDCNLEKICFKNELDYSLLENKVNIGINDFDYGSESCFAYIYERYDDEIFENEYIETATSEIFHSSFVSNEDKSIDKENQSFDCIDQESHFPFNSSDVPSSSIFKLKSKSANKRSLDLDIDRKLKILKSSELPNNYLVNRFKSKKNTTDNGIKVNHFKSKYSGFCMPLTPFKSKNPIKFNQVCKSCKKFFVNKYLRCHRSISLNCKDNKDSFLINAILSLMCYKHLKGKCPHDAKKCSKFLGYFKDAINRKMTFSNNYIKLKKTVETVAKHLQKCNKFHHSMFLSALALNYHSKNIKKAKVEVSSNQLRSGCESVDLVVQTCMTNFDIEIDTLLSEVAIETREEFNKTCKTSSHKKKDTSLNDHFVDLSRFSRDVTFCSTPLKKKLTLEKSNSLVRDTLEIQNKSESHKINHKSQEFHNSWKQMKNVNLHGYVGKNTRENKPIKKVKLTATGGKLIHSRPSSYMPEFHKIKSRSFATGSPLCRVSSSDEVIPCLPESHNQDIAVCSTSLETLSETVSEPIEEETKSIKVQYSHHNNSTDDVQETVSNSQTSSHFFMPNRSNESHFSKETSHQYTTFSARDPLLRQRVMYPAPTIGLQYPWNNMVFTFQSPPPILGMTYPMPHPITFCNSFIPTNIAPPHPVPAFFHVPPPFCHKVPVPVVRPFDRNITPSMTDMGIVKERTNTTLMSRPGQLNSPSKRIYAFNKDRSLTHNIEKFLQFKGAVTFDPFNIVMLRNIPNIQYFILIHLQDLNKLDRIPNILQLKKDLRVQFVVYKNVHDVKYQKFELIFPKGGMLVIEEETFLTLDSGTLRKLCESLKKQMIDKVKPWRLMLSENIKQVLSCLISGSPDSAQTHQRKGLLNTLNEFENSGLIHFCTGSGLILRPINMQEYLKNCLILQSSYCFQFRHFLFLTDELIEKEDSLKFTSQGIDILTISAFARGFLSMVIEKPKVSHKIKSKTLRPEYLDAVLSSAAKCCTISF